MSFQTDPKWSPEELALHRERWELLMEMNNCYTDNTERYKKLATRYHDINRILGDDDYNL